MKRKQLLAKPWLTRGLLKSINHNNNLFEKLYKNYNEKLLENYKKYRNLLNRAINTTKEHYYIKVITENNTNQTNLWKVINEIEPSKAKINQFLMNHVNNGLTKDPEIICNTLKNFFINIGKNLANSIEQVVMEPASLSKQSQINNSFFFSPAVSEEIILIIRNLKSKKAIREQDIDTKFLKYSNQIISLFICDLFNPCMEQGKFPTALKIAEVRPNTII